MYNTQAERKKEAATPRIVTQWDPALPTWFLKSPAIAAAANGSRGINNNIVFSDISALQVVQFGHVDGLAVTEQNHEDRQANRRFGRSYGQDEKYEYLPVQIAEVA